MNTKNKTEEAKALIAKICDKYSDGNFIFRGTTKIFSGGDKRVRSSLYHWAQKKKAINKHHKPPKIEEEIVKEARKHFPDRASNIEILTDIRHFSGKVNLIDFTRSLYVALFFACNSAFDEDSEIIVVNTKQLPRMTDIKYDNSDDEGMMGIIEPATTQASQLRVVAQDSIFVYFVDGYVGKSHFENKKIPKGLKKGILDFIKKFSNIDQDTVYNDLIGFIDNGRSYATDSIRFYQGNAKYYLGKYEDAIEGYSEAIELSPKIANAYNNRGNAKSALGDYKEAIKDYNKELELNPQFAGAYYNRGTANSSLEKHKEAIKDFDKAIALNPKYADAYHNRGTAKSSLGEYQEAINDFDKAITLNPQNAEAYNNRGLSKSRLGKDEEAIKDYDQAIEIDPQFAGAYHNRGVSKGKLGDMAGVEADLVKHNELEKQQKGK